jgi:hypothetical protein
MLHPGSIKPRMKFRKWSPRSLVLPRKRIESRKRIEPRKRIVGQVENGLGDLVRGLKILPGKNKFRVRKGLRHNLVIITLAVEFNTSFVF